MTVCAPAGAMGGHAPTRPLTMSIPTDTTDFPDLDDQAYPEDGWD
jgi:hypothetical protein